MGKGASPSPCFVLGARITNRAPVPPGPRARLMVVNDGLQRNTTIEKVRQHMTGIESLTQQALADIAAAETPDAIEALRVSLLGKNGSVTAQLKQLGALPPDQRKTAGEAINKARDELTAALGERRTVLDDAALDARLSS